MAGIFSFKCSSCGKLHEGSPSYSFNAPAPYLEQSQDVKDKGSLGSDLCFYSDEDGLHFFIRVVLEIPIHGVTEPFTWGVWASVSETSYNHYLENFETPSLEHGYFGCLCNYLPFYENTYALPSDLNVQLDGMRPIMYLHASEHPLFFDLQNGISIQRAQEIAEYCLHKKNG